MKSNSWIKGKLLLWFYWTAGSLLDAYLVTLALGAPLHQFAERAFIFSMYVFGLPLLWAFPIPWPWWVVYLYLLTLLGQTAIWWDAGKRKML